MTKLDFVPFERVGPFRFGTHIDQYELGEEAEFYPEDEDTGWESCDIEELGLSIYTEGGKIESICATREFFFGDMNLIGASFPEVKALPGIGEIVDTDQLFLEDESEPQEIYDFDESGLQLWVKNEVVVAAIPSSE